MPCRHNNDVEAFADILADLHPMAGAAGAGRELGLNDFFDPLEMRRKRLAAVRGANALGMNSFQLRLDGAETGLDLVEHELMLIIVQNFGAPPKASALQHLQDRLKPGDPSFRVVVGSTQLGSLRFESVGLAPHGQNHRLQRFDIIGKSGSRVSHARI
jgi:hypothetical protein